MEGKTVVITIEDALGSSLETLRIKLHHLCTGPFHHDHLLKELKSRMIFDFYMEQELQFEGHCLEMKVSDESKSDSAFGYSMCMVVIQSSRSFSTATKS